MFNRRSQRLVTEINITPLTDVILVILIIFMVATPLIFQSSIKIQLLESSSKQEPPRDITVTVSSQGEAYLNNKQYNLRLDSKILQFQLAALFKDKPNSQIVIRGDKNVKYDYIIKVIDLASQVGMKNIVLATELTNCGTDCH